MGLPDGPVSRHPIVLRVFADFSELPVLRALAETVTLLAEFDPDEVTDVKLAVDEVCSVLIKAARSDADLVCRFHVVDDALRVQAWTDTTTARVPDERSFGWQVLHALTDSIAVTHDPLAAGGFRTCVDFVKSKGGDTAGSIGE